jgi:hypothetical protein
MADDLVQSRMVRNRITYPNKFLDLGQTYFPVDVKELIRLCRIFYYQSPLIRNIVDKMSEYPISDIILTVNNEETDDAEGIKAKYNDILNKDLRIKKLLLETGINYMVNGSVILTFYQDFKRFFTCSSCKATFDGEKGTNYKVGQRNKKIRITGKCPSCGVDSAELTISDVPIKSADAINIIMWNPLELEVEYNPWNGKKKFFHPIPAHIKQKLFSVNGNKNKSFLLELPAIYFSAIETNQNIELDAYHIGTPELAQDKRGLNVPIVVSVLKDVWYYNTMRKAQESILGEHIVPFRAVFPQPTGSVDPFTLMRMDRWTSVLTEQIKQQKRDPNHIMISPIPIGTTSIGGDAKFLMVTNELRLIEENITQGFGAPAELVKGGVSWSGSSISLRILENHFLSYRQDLELLLNSYIIPKISKLVGLPMVEARFSRLRMGDDQQFKQLMLQLVQGGFLSLQTFLDELGFNADKEKKAVITEAEWFNNLKEIQGVGMAQVQGLQTMISAKFGVKAQEEQMIEQALVQFKQQQAAQPAGTAPNIRELADRFMNTSSDQERKALLKEITGQYGKDVANQLITYLQTLSEQEMPAEQQKPERTRAADKRVGSSPTGVKDRKPERTQDRVKGSKTTAT